MKAWMKASVAVGALALLASRRVRSSPPMRRIRP